MQTIEQRAAAYLAKMPPAVAGNGGHAATFAAACRLVEFALTFEQAMPLLESWNVTHCQPPWTEAELRHKLADAFKRTLPKAVFSPLRSPSPIQERRFKRILERRFTPAIVKAGQSSQQTKLDAFAAKLRKGTEAELNALAMLRGLSFAALALASARGLLRFGEFHGQPAWFILDRSCRVIQARRLDGQKWTPTAKAWTLAGSQSAWPVGIGEAETFSAVALCEGGPDLLAACHFIDCEGRERDCAPVVMLGGCARIQSDALPLFTGKRVRIFRHSDSTGENAADRWAAQLDEHGSMVDAFRLDGLRRMDGQTVNDLNDLATIHADDFEAHRNLWGLFDYARPVTRN